MAILEYYRATPQEIEQPLPGDHLLDADLAVDSAFTLGAITLYEQSGFSKGETFLWLDKTLSADFRRTKSKAYSL